MAIDRYVVLLSFLVCLLISVLADEDDLYAILGVPRTATTKEIKSAYRKKALATHPDKNKDVPPEEAAQAFHKVVHAFEVLTDESSRKTYDRTGNSEQQQAGGGQQQWRGFQFRRQDFYWYDGYGYQQPLKEKFEVKEAMSRVMHVVSLEQLKNIMLDDDEKLERNLLMIFVTPLEVETICDDELVFPYPFAAMSTQGIWWEDLLQTVKVRYYRENDLTRFFGIPHGDQLQSPVILFSKRGQTLDPANFERLQTRNRHEFETWTWQRIQVKIWFVNEHTHAVEIFWIHDRSAQMMLTLEAGARESHTTMLSHEWWIRDARVDTRADSPRRNKLTKESLLGIWKIISDQDGQEIRIQSKECVDMSGHCEFWESTTGECANNPYFMANQCPKTCKLCVDLDDDKPNNVNTDKYPNKNETSAPQEIQPELQPSDDQEKGSAEL
jgi:curved DNA-binding protein CbpA